MIEQTKVIETTQGENQVLIQIDGPQVQYNCFMPAAGGAGVYAVFDRDLLGVVRDHAFRAILEAGPHPENADLRHLAYSPLEAKSVTSVATASVNRLMAEQECAGCKPGAAGQPFTAEQYQEALKMLEQRHDLNPEQRQQAQEVLDKVAQQAGVA